MVRKLLHFADFAKLPMIAELLNKATGIPLSIVDPNGTIFARAGRLRICNQFCRLNPGERQFCAGGDPGIAAKVLASRTYTVDKCGSGLMNGSMPITLSSEYAGNFVAGPVLFKSPDTSLFKQQALRFGFDESRYLDQVSKVPVVAKTKLHAVLHGFSVLADTVSEASGALPKQREGTDSKFKENIASNVKNLILPYVERLKKSKLSVGQRNIMEILESNLRGITSPIVGKMQTLGLTAREIAVASLSGEGKTTRQIAGLMGVSAKAIEFHRYNIRKKLGINHKKINLSTYLLSIMQE
ncbi:MAG TPA: PocR ligand-binding domain-containing protein [Syntrophorhabdaceae bacterium]|nr:PocR ligand-binding domain-containing protein [Syntrophorhabdaceae bacterium]